MTPLGRRLIVPGPFSRTFSVPFVSIRNTRFACFRSSCTPATLVSCLNLMAAKTLRPHKKPLRRRYTWKPAWAAVSALSRSLYLCFPVKNTVHNRNAIPSYYDFSVDSDGYFANARPSNLDVFYAQRRPWCVQTRGRDHTRVHVSQVPVVLEVH